MPSTDHRSLCIAEAYPWPAVDGYKLRLANMIEGLLLRGPVDFLCLDGSGRHRDPAPDGVTVIDESQGPIAGLATMEDLLKTLFGELTKTPTLQPAPISSPPLQGGEGS